MRRSWFVGVFVAVGCTGGSGSSGGSEATGAETTSTGATTGSGTTAEPTTEAPTSATGETTSVSSTTEAPAEYCHGFDRDAPAPFFELTVKGGAPLADGVTWPLECGGQGLWMFGLYPSLGGFEPGGDYTLVKVVVDVAGLNIGPSGYFYLREDEAYYIGCEELDGGVPGVVPAFPPDELAELSAVDGLPAQVHVEVETPDGPLVVDATVTLAAPPDVVALGCGL